MFAEVWLPTWGVRSSYTISGRTGAFDVAVLLPRSRSHYFGQRFTPNLWLGHVKGSYPNCKCAHVTETKRVRRDASWLNALCFTWPCDI